MPVAAVPKYLPAGEFAKSSPALRFGLLLSIWTEPKDQEKEVLDRASTGSGQASDLKRELGENNRNLAQVNNGLIQEGKIPALWSKNDHAGRQAWQMVSALTKTDKNLMTALAGRTHAVAGLQAGDTLWQAEAEATAPFTTGLGNEHPLENGFSFLNPYGLPYLPGSGVKGVVREAARQLASGEWEDPRGWHTEFVGEFRVREDGEEKPIKLTTLDVLFGRETPEGESGHFRGVLSFWDVIPEISGNTLRVEVMTPHQTHYYQQKQDRKSGASTTPHDSGQPNPILFLTVPPGSKFHFFVTCDLARLKRVAPSLAKEDRWKQLLDAAFEHAFDWLGFGAKTAVGYGAMRRKARPAAGPSGELQGAFGAKKSTAGAEEQLEIWENATLKWNPGKQEITASCTGKPNAILAQGLAKAFLESLSQEQREQLKNKKSLGPVRLCVRAEGNKVTIVGLA